MSQLQEVLPPNHPNERHLPCVILADCSGSMKDAPIAELNEGLVAFGEALKADTQAQGRVDVCVISFATTVKTELGFRSAEEYAAPVLTADGCTAFNQAINVALDALEEQKNKYRQIGMNYFRPWLFVLTDGYPTDPEYETDTRNRLQEFISRNKVNYIPMGIGSADIAHLQSYYPSDAEKKPVLKAEHSNFKQAFVWLSKSTIGASRSDMTMGKVESEPIPSTISLAL